MEIVEELGNISPTSFLPGGGYYLGKVCVFHFHSEIKDCNLLLVRRVVDQENVSVDFFFMFSENE